MNQKKPAYMGQVDDLNSQNNPCKKRPTPRRLEQFNCFQYSLVLIFDYKLWTEYPKSKLSFNRVKHLFLPFELFKQKSCWT